MGLRRAQMRIPTAKRFVRPSVDFLLASARARGVSADECSRLDTIADLVLHSMVEHGQKGAFDAEIEIAVCEDANGLAVEITNRGLPVSSMLPKIREEISQKRSGLGAGAIIVENLGRQGQCVKFNLDAPPAMTDLSLANLDFIEKPNEENAFQIRRLLPGEESALTELFFNVYEYNYINDDVYFPERLRAMIDDGRLISTVAVSASGEIVGHVGLVRLNHDPIVYEAALGVVDPRIKSRGLFSQVFRETMEVASTLPMSYCVFDFVTNHDFSQKRVAHYNPRDMALFVGCQTKSTQASLGKLGIGSDPSDMDRCSLLQSITTSEAHPFGKEIRLPSNLGEILEFILKPLGLAWVPSPRFDLLPQDGHYALVRQPSQNALHFDLENPGRTALRHMLEQWRGARREGYQYVSVTLPVLSPGLGELYDSLAANGFFIAGFVPYRNTGALGIRFQALGPSRVAFDKIKVYTGTARNLLACVEADYLRNSQL